MKLEETDFSMSLGILYKPILRMISELEFGSFILLFFIGMVAPIHWPQAVQRTHHKVGEIKTFLFTNCAQILLKTI